MQIIVAGRNIEISEALRARVTEKVGRLAHHFEQVHKAQVVLRVEPHPGRNQIVEVTVWADGVVLRGEEASADMYASIDHVVDKLDKQISKFRDRVIKRRRLIAGRRKHQAAVAAETALREGPGETETAPVQIYRRKRFEMKPMTPEEAAVQMELLGHTFYMFRNSETLEVSVVYRRADGRYGLIEPEG
ncbi:MAG: ribosome-associated translation inhibitor RaiA [Bacillati bacterium ANGP1]|uniref:Ribosome hibernation promoting factor n=1 Tax=Candidatus Segetimicrobium genomatis TaxID=2569760 RepID=A0A537JCM3_9BACT|nr:MAG: ribosome-associated translation inhibitor RaiA [Terrabacteria group bacterium ANGP1]